MVNKFASKCTTCQVIVNAGAGTVSKVDNKWAVDCGQHSVTVNVSPIVNTEAVTVAKQQLAEARLQMVQAEREVAKTFPILMAARATGGVDYDTAHANHSANTTRYLVARRRVAQGYAKIENLRRG